MSIMISQYTIGLRTVYNFVIPPLVSFRRKMVVSSEVSVGVSHNCPIVWDPVIHQLNLCYLIMYWSVSITNLYTFQLQMTLWKEKMCPGQQFYGHVTGDLGSAPVVGGGRLAWDVGCLKDPRMNRNIIWRTNFLSSHWFACLSFSFIFCFWCRRENKRNKGEKTKKNVDSLWRSPEANPLISGLGWDHIPLISGPLVLAG